MTGFVAVLGPDDSEAVLAGARVSVRPDGARLQIVHSTAGLSILATDDLPVARCANFIAVGDISLADPEAITRTLEEQRRLGLAALTSAYAAGAHAPAGFAEDYHFVLWDDERQALLAGRDGLGVRPLFHASSGGRFIVASAVRFALGAGAAPELDEGSVARFVAGRMPAHGRTYYRAVSRLPVGARLSKSRGEDARVSACEPPIGRPQPWTGGDPVEAFRIAFTRAVGERLARADETTALLSGGLDSSSITVVAAHLYNSRRLPSPETLSLVFDDTPQWSERPYICDVKDAAGLEGPMVEGKTDHPFESISSLFEAHGGLFLAPGLVIGGKLYGLSAQRGRSVLLDGHGGDEVVSYGWGRLHSVAEAGRWRKLWSLLQGVGPSGARERQKLFALYWMKYGPARRWISRWMRLRRGVARRLIKGERAAGAIRFVAPPWRTRLGDDEAKPHVDGAETGKEAAQHYGIVSASQQAIALETLHAAASAQGIAPRYPFWDRELIELCLSLPEAAKLNDCGLARWVLRQAVALPASVRRRPDKLDFSPHLALGLVDGEHARFEQLLRSQKGAPVWCFVNRVEATRALRTLRRRRERTPGEIVQGLWRISVLSMWLDHRAASGLDDACGDGMGA